MLRSLLVQVVSEFVFVLFSLCGFSFEKTVCVELATVSLAFSYGFGLLTSNLGEYIKGVC